MGEDNFLNMRSPNRRTSVEFTHLPDSERFSSKTIKFGLVLFLYPLLQLIHCLILPNLNREWVGPAENPTGERELVI